MITSTTIKTILSNKVSKDALRQAIFNTGKLGWSKDHVTNVKGEAYLSVSVVAGYVVFKDTHNRDLTKIVIKFLRNK